MFTLLFGKENKMQSLDTDASARLRTTKGQQNTSPPGAVFDSKKKKRCEEQNHREDLFLNWFFVGHPFIARVRLHRAPTMYPFQMQKEEIK